MKLIQIKNDHDKTLGNVNENTSLETIRQHCPLFFTGRRKRETFTMYRGQIIARCTVQFSNCPPERHTAVYLYFVDGEMENDSFCVSAGHNLKTTQQAKHLIDKILDGGKYEYGMPI
jgi:hypothetical protein